jgi:hypothetical protein
MNNILREEMNSIFMEEMNNAFSGKKIIMFIQSISSLNKHYSLLP